MQEIMDLETWSRRLENKHGNDMSQEHIDNIAAIHGFKKPSLEIYAAASSVTTEISTLSKFLNYYIELENEGQQINIIVPGVMSIEEATHKHNPGYEYLMFKVNSPMTFDFEAVLSDYHSEKEGCNCKNLEEETEVMKGLANIMKGLATSSQQ